MQASVMETAVVLRAILEDSDFTGLNHTALGFNQPAILEENGREIARATPATAARGLVRLDLAA
jgi:hypothetical protein